MWRKYFDAGLWSKEFRQARIMLGAMFVLGFGSFPLTRMNSWWFRSSEWITNEVEVMKRQGLAQYSELDNMFQMLTLVMCILAAILSLWQMGYERRAGIQEFTWSLPYSRRTIFMTKWLLGISFITGTILIQCILDATVILTSALAPYMMWGTYLLSLVTALLSIVVIYTGALFIGTIAGSWATQVLFTGAVLFFPSYLISTLRVLFKTFHLDHIKLEAIINRYLVHISLFPELTRETITGWGVLLLLIVILLISGMFAYERNRVENNGKLVNIPIWEKVIIISGVMCFGLLGGYLSYYITSFGLNSVSYLLGFLVASVVGYLLLKTIARMRLRV